MSQESKIFEILKDGAWHATYDIVRELHAGPIINLKGRISDLNHKRYCVIISQNDRKHCEHFGLTREPIRSMWWYKMVDYSNYLPPGRLAEMGQGSLLKEGSVL